MSFRRWKTSDDFADFFFGSLKHNKMLGISVVMQYKERGGGGVGGG